MPTEIQSPQVLMKHRSPSPNVTKNLPMAGFNPIIYGRFWAITEVEKAWAKQKQLLRAA